MKMLLINGSPRKKSWNTATLLEHAARGAEAAGAETELIHLYDYAYKGCVSCLACKLKDNRTNALCAFRDELTPVLQKALVADALVLGAPVYFSSAPGQFRSFLERFCFPIYSYDYSDGSDGRPPHPLLNRDKRVPSALVWTMNCREEQMARFNYSALLGINESTLAVCLGSCESLYVNDTYQFGDYSRYSHGIFDAEAKKRRHERHFPIDCQKAFDLGKKLAEQAIK